MIFSRPKSVPFQVEVALSEDLAVLSDIHAKSFAHAWNGDELHRMMQESGALMLVARSPGQDRSASLRGFVLIRTVAGEAEVLTLAVHPEHRGRGLARALMQHALFQLYSDRCDCLFLEVDAANAPALHLYKALGFRKVGERKSYYSSGDGDGTALVMRVDLR
ncbi:ribosomal protein S18-alanine N-acetyltransferase [Roseibium sp.]|uniref:ribosomal protein S18-alanine N-acetyltransferase n=1 Tax=Roseibium sp. TaxID=1936156 RepID=UPI003A980A14